MFNENDNILKENQLKHKMIITISGDLASGKSTVAKEIAKKLGYKHYSAGDLYRMIAEEENITLLEVQTKAQDDPEYDKRVDALAQRVGEEEDNFVIDGHITYYFIPSSFKIFLKCDPKVAAERASKEGRKAEKYSSLEEAEETLQKRMNIEKGRYKKYYDLDHPRLDSFDLIIDTSHKPVEEIVSEILNKLS